MLPWRTATGWPSTSASTSTPSPASSTQGARMKIACSGPPSQSSSASKEASWRPNALRRTRHVEHVEVVAVEHDQARAGAEHRAPGAHELAQWLGQSLALHAEGDRGRLAAGDHQPVDALEVGGHAHAARLRRRVPRAPWRAPRSRPAGPVLRLFGASTNRGSEAARRRPRACRSRCRASLHPVPSRPRPPARRRRSGWWPRRSRGHGARDRRT